MALCKSCDHQFDLLSHYPMGLTQCGHTLCLKCTESPTNKRCPSCLRMWLTCVKNYSLAEWIQENRANSNLRALFKIAFVGDVFVGKTTAIRALKGDTFQSETRPTMSCDLQYIEEMRNGKPYLFQIWDTVGAERFQSISKSHYKNAQMVVLVYAVNSMKSFERIKDYWRSQVIENTDSTTLKLVLGNKIDIEPEWEVNQEDVEEFCSREGFLHSTISCKSNENVKKTRQLILQSLIDTFDRQSQRNRNNPEENGERRVTGLTQAPGIRLSSRISIDLNVAPNNSRYCC